MNKEEFYDYLISRVQARTNNALRNEFEINKLRKDIENSPIAKGIEDILSTYETVEGYKQFSNIMENGGEWYELLVNDYIASQPNIHHHWENKGLDDDLIWDFIVYASQIGRDKRDAYTLLLEVMNRYEVFDNMKAKLEHFFGIFEFDSAEKLHLFILNYSNSKNQ